MPSYAYGIIRVHCNPKTYLNLAYTYIYILIIPFFIWPPTALVTLLQNPIEPKHSRTLFTNSCYEFSFQKAVIRHSGSSGEETDSLHPVQGMLVAATYGSSATRNHADLHMVHRNNTTNRG